MPWAKNQREEEWIAGAPAGKQYKGWMRGPDGVERPVYAVSGRRAADNAEGDPAGAPRGSAGNDVAPMRTPPAPPDQPRGFTLTGMPPEDGPSYQDRMAMDRRVRYGARATSPNADVGSLGSDQRRWERYNASRQPAGERPPGIWRRDLENIESGRRDWVQPRVLGEYDAWNARRQLGQNKLAAESFRQKRKTLDLLLDEQKLRQGEGRYQMDLEEADRKRGLLPYDVWEREQRIRKGAQEMEQSGTRFGWEQADRPMTQAERAQKMMRDQAAEGRARTGETRAAEEHEWNRNNPMKNPTAGTEPAPAGGPAPAATTPDNVQTYSPKQAATLPAGTLFRGEDGKLRRR